MNQTSYDGEMDKNFSIVSIHNIFIVIVIVTGSNC